jgi:succinate-semialdehyde dehydrogenase/glutarate-semialdehyde dehydrogenase
MAAVVVGDPMDPPTIVGPLVSSAQRDLLSAQVADGLAQGAQRLVGVGSLEGPGFFYAPTVLTNVSRSSRAGSEELFGPVAVVESVDTLDDAIAVANGTPWGLGGSIWSEDESEIDKAIAGPRGRYGLCERHCGVDSRTAIWRH